MTKPIQHFGWPVSPYSAKTRAYLRFKGLRFEDRRPHALQLFTTIRRAVGRAVMPTVRRPDGTWLQDSSEIIDALEATHPEPSVTPAGPTQRVAALLLELHGDEWLPMVAMHFRWNYPENRRFAEDEFARYGLPGAPLLLARRVTEPVARRMRSYLPVLGVTPATEAAIERFTADLVRHLDAHLSSHDYLLGGRPCIGDFALYGPLWAHVYRDPASRFMFDTAPAVRAWFERLERPSPTPGAFAPGDRVPETLDPIFRTLFDEQWPFLGALVEHIDRWCADNPGATRVPRALGSAGFSVAGQPGERRLVTFQQWMLQRPLEAYAALTDDERRGVDAWLDRIGAAGALDLPIAHPFERREFKMQLRTPA